MDGREPSGLFYMNSSCDDPSREAQFDRWYQDVHFKDVARIGILANPLMFHHAKASPPSGEGKFLAIYEIYREDLERAMEEFVRLGAGLLRDFDAQPGSRRIFRGAYRVRHRVFSGDQQRRTQSLLAVFVDCADPARAGAVDRWLAEVRVPGVVGRGLCHTGSVSELVSYEAVTREPPKPRFLVLYESAARDVEVLAAEVARRFPDVRLPSYARVIRDAAFYRASP